MTWHDLFAKDSIILFFRPPNAYWSDPRLMSTLVDPQFPRKNPNGQLCLVPNIYDPRRPLPVDVPPNKIPALYQLLLSDDLAIQQQQLQEQQQQQQQQQRAQEDEERALYSGSTNPLPADW